MMPVLFVGHGSPTNAIENNEYTKTWELLAKQIPKPAAILAISAHWVTEGTKITAMEHPETIHDFYGFPKALNELQYPARGSPHVAKLVQETITSMPVHLTQEWGLDHGTWSVLVHMYPKADIPVLQLSIDANLTEKQMYEIGKELMQLRKQKILIVGLGNIVHNLARMYGAASPWAAEFENFVKENLEKRNDQALIDYAQHPAAKMACPTPEHYVPLLYVLGASEGKPELLNQGIVMGSISMMSVLIN